MLKLGASWPVGDGWSLWPEGLYCRSDCKQETLSSTDTSFSQTAAQRGRRRCGKMCACPRILWNWWETQNADRYNILPHLTYQQPNTPLQRDWGWKCTERESKDSKYSCFSAKLTEPHLFSTAESHSLSVSSCYVFYTIFVFLHLITLGFFFFCLVTLFLSS